MPRPTSSPADFSANRVEGIPIRENMMVMPCPSQVLGAHVFIVGTMDELDDNSSG